MAWQTSIAGKKSGLPTRRDSPVGAGEPSSQEVRSRLDSLGPVGSCFARYLAFRLDLLTAPEAQELSRSRAPLESLAGEHLKTLLREDLGVSIEEAFAALGKINEAVGVPFSSVVRLWLYQGGITEIEDEQERYRIVWEYSPFQLFQVRAGFTSFNGVPQFPITNRSEFFIESHVFF